MKLTDYDVPPEFTDQMALLMTALASEPGGTRKARTRRRARRAIKTHTVRPQLAGIIDACSTLADRLGYKIPTQARSDFIYKQVRAILRGEFDIAYWREQDKTSQVSIASVPTSVPNPFPAPYSYLDPGNMPTIPTYPNGALNEGPPRYVGSTFGTHYEDTLLKWRRTVYRLDEDLNNRSDEPVFAVVEGTLDINTSTRGDRPLASLMINAQFGAAGVVPEFDGTPPIQDAMSFYWRYKAPAATAPYYHVVHPRRVVARLYPSADDLDFAPLGSIALCVFPRPMFGHEQNNNTTVTVILDHTEKIYQIEKCATLRGQVSITRNYISTTPPIHDTINITVKKGESVYGRMSAMLDETPDLPPNNPPINFRNPLGKSKAPPLLWKSCELWINDQYFTNTAVASVRLNTPC